MLVNIEEEFMVPWIVNMISSIQITPVVMRPECKLLYSNIRRESLPNQSDVVYFFDKMVPFYFGYQVNKMWVMKPEYI